MTKILANNRDLATDKNGCKVIAGYKNMLRNDAWFSKITLNFPKYLTTWNGKYFAVQLCRTSVINRISFILYTQLRR